MGHALAPMAGGSFESAPPVAEALWLADDIHRQVDQLDAELRTEGRKGHLIDMALDDTETARRIVRRLGALVTTARIALDYDAPIVTLRDVYCPQCGGDLRVRSDASSAVWCARLGAAARARARGRTLADWRRAVRRPVATRVVGVAP
jgi:hypothetical protein